VRALDVDQSIGPVRMMEDYLGESSQLPRFRTFVLALLALLATTLATIGIYSVTAYAVSQRNRELGLRMVLGAERSDILKMVLLQSGRPAAWGILIGIALALGITRVLQNMLFEVSSRDPTTFVVIPATLMIVALLGCYFPARRATRVDPMSALRET
jgi:putative ABC transport system permease protein